MKMMKNFSFLIFVLFLGLHSFAQIELKKYPRIISNNAENEIAPCLSMDGNTMLFTKKRAMDEEWMTQIIKKENGNWSKPVDFMHLNKLTKLRLMGSYCLNKNGTEILFVSKKTGGLGAFDIWSSKKTGESWSEPENLGRPLNSALDEINPFFTLDGNKIYFIQKSTTAENGKVFTSFRKNNIWSTPKAVAVAGDFFAVRIAADTQTMYLSKIMGEKTFLYFSKLKNGSWTTPQRIEGIAENTDKFFTLDSKSNLLTISQKDEFGYDLFTAKLPENQSASTVTALSISSKEQMKIEISKTDTKEKVFKGTTLTDYYLLNNAKYTVKISYKSHLPYVQEVDLSKATANTKVLTPILTPLSKSNLAIIEDFDSSKTFSKTWMDSYADALKQTLAANPTFSAKVVFYQSDTSFSATQSLIYSTKVVDSVLVDLVYQTRTHYSNDLTENTLNELKKTDLHQLKSIKFEKSYLKPKGLECKKRGVYIEIK
jgi:hypothetical protein